MSRERQGGMGEQAVSKKGQTSFSGPHSFQRVSDRRTHLGVAQQDNPHQHNIDVGPQGLIMVDFIDLKDSQGDISRNYGPKTTPAVLLTSCP